MTARKTMMPVMGREAMIRADSVDEKARTAQVIFTTGAPVRRRQFFGEEFDEELEVSAKAVRLNRLNSGAPFLDTHNSFDLNSVIGVVVDGSARIENGRGVATIRFSNREDVTPIFEDVQSGVIRNISVGYRVHKYEIEKRDGEPELRRAVDWEPMEISAVPIGADPGAQVREDQAREFECALEYRERTPAAPPANNGAKTMPDGNTPGAPAKQTRADIDAEIRNIATRNKLDADFVEDLVKRKVDISEAKDAILEELAKRDDANTGHTQVTEPGMSDSRADAFHSQNAMAAAIVQRCIPTYEAQPEAEAFRGWSFVDMAAECLERAGVSTRGMRPSKIIKTALGDAGAFQRSTAPGYGALGSGDFVGTIGDAARQILLERYRLAPPALKTVSTQRNLVDYREQKSIRGSAFPELKQVNEHGEITHGTIGDSGETISLVRYGRRVGLTHQALVNDAIGQFDDLMTNAAETAISQESTLLAAKLEQNPNMADNEAVFSAAHSNLVDPGGVPSEAALSVLRSAMRQQTGLAGERIAPTPRYLVVPTQLETDAEKLVSTVQAAKTADANVFSNLGVVVEPRLTDPAAWYLAAEPSQVEGLRWGYLDEENGPVVDQRMGWEYDGIEIRVRLSFGAGFVDYRGWQKNAGA